MRSESSRKNVEQTAIVTFHETKLNVNLRVTRFIQAGLEWFDSTAIYWNRINTRT